MLKRIYCDHNASAPILPEVVEAMVECHARWPGNPASQHRTGREARRALEDAREAIAELLGARLAGPRADRLIFTSGGSEANNLALLGMAAARGGPPGEAIVSSIEHPSVMAAAVELERAGWCVSYLDANLDGAVSVEHFDELLSPRTALVSVMLANNETGAFQPVAELAERAAAAGVFLHTDAAQAAGKAHVDFRSLGVAALSVAAHKFHGPLGIGALVLRHDVRLAPRVVGGVQQSGLRAGTECVALAVGMRTALEACRRDASRRGAQLAELRDRFERELGEVYPPLVVNASGSARLSNTSNLAFVGLDRQALLVALDLAGIDCSTGSACASGSSEPSPVLRAMGCAKGVIDSSLRFSFGVTATAAEIDEAIERIATVCRRLSGLQPPLAAAGLPAGDQQLLPHDEKDC